MNSRLSRTLVALSACGIAMLLPVRSVAAGQPADVRARIERSRQRLLELAAHAEIVAAARAASAAMAGPVMSNERWSALNDADPAVQGALGHPASRVLARWEAADASLGELVLRDARGHLVGASHRPERFSDAIRPVVTHALKGDVWAASEFHPDPTTHLPGIRVSVPVMDGARVIGVLQARVTACDASPAADPQVRARKPALFPRMNVSSIADHVHDCTDANTVSPVC